MLINVLIGILFFVNTTVLGFYVAKAIQFFIKVKYPLNSILELLLLGVVCSFIYFNIISFFTGVHYIATFPLILISIYTIVQYSNKLSLSISNYFVTRKQDVFLYLSIFVVLLFFLASPPINYDSRDYHFTSINYYEQYKVIPGLANIHGRLAFNPASFIISAAYSFTGLFKQSIYPINFVLVFVFCCWFIKNMFTKTTAIAIIGSIALLGILRQFFPNISSPSSDTLALILAFYIGMHCYKLFTINNSTQYNIVVLFIFCIFCMVVKLTLAPLLILALILFIQFKLWQNKKAFVLLLISGLIIILPWLVRNIIMSGYLAYPLLQIDIFSFDWKAPKELLELDIYCIKKIPKWIQFDVYNFRINFYNWIPNWILAHAKMNRLLELPFLFSAFLSPILWVLIKVKKLYFHPTLFTIWFIFFIGCTWWLFSSPEYRFGYSFLVITAIYPWLILFNKSKPVTYKIKIAINSIIILYSSVAYWNHTKHERFYSSSVANFWLFPLKDKELLKGVDNIYKIDSFKNFSIYYADMTDCIHINQPCVGWKYGTVKPRGKSIEDGFVLEKNEVYKNYPLLLNDSVYIKPYNTTTFPK